MSQKLRQEILSRSDYHRGLLNFIENNPGCTSDDMFNSDVANAIIPIGIREMAITLWIKQLIKNGEIESRKWRLYPTGSAEWSGHNIIKKENHMRITETQLRRVITEAILQESNYLNGRDLDNAIDKLKRIIYEAGRREEWRSSGIPREYHYGNMAAVKPVFKYSKGDASLFKVTVHVPAWLKGSMTPWESIEPMERDFFIEDLKEAFPGSRYHKGLLMIPVKNWRDFQQHGGKYDKTTLVGMPPGELSF